MNRQGRFHPTTFDAAVPWFITVQAVVPQPLQYGLNYVRLQFARLLLPSSVDTGQMTRNSFLALAMLPLLASTAGTQTAPSETAFPRLYEGLVRQYVIQLRNLPELLAVTDRGIFRIQEDSGDLGVEARSSGCSVIGRRAYCPA